MTSRSTGRCGVYVLVSAYEDQLKVGQSRDLLARLQAFHPRWYEAFDLDASRLVDTETVRDARTLELSLKRRFVAHNAPPPLTIARAAGGHTEWFRGAASEVDAAVGALAAHGYAVHAPLRDWLRAALVARAPDLYAWAEQAFDVVDARGEQVPAVAAAARVRDVLDAFVALDVSVSPHLPDAAMRWHLGTTLR